MSVDSELDKIINDGKVNSSTAMVIFAVELKQQGERITELKKSLDGDNNRYATKENNTMLERRVGRLENAALGVLVFVFVAVATAVVGLVLVKQ